MESSPERFPSTAPKSAAEAATQPTTSSAPDITAHLASNPEVTDPKPAATMADASAGDAPAAGPDASPEVEAVEQLPYRLGAWSGIPAVFCRWPQPNGSECSAGFLTEEEFWNHHTDHIIRSMTPEERAAAILAAQAAQNPSVIVDARGNPIR